MLCRFHDQSCTLPRRSVNGVRGDFCLYHARIKHLFRIREAKVVNFNEHVSRMERARLRKAKSRLLKKDALKIIAATDTGRIALVLAKL